MPLTTLCVTVIDCPEPEALARFYARLLGGEIRSGEAGSGGGTGWVNLYLPDGARLAFQLAPGFEPPVWPSADGSQQLHLDLRVRDMAAAQEEALASGATPLDLDDEGGKRDFRVYADPVGHPFCLLHPVRVP